MPSSPPTSLQVHLKLTLAALFWATTPIFGRLLSAYQAPYALACGRFMIATVVLWLFLRGVGATARRIERADWPAFLLLGLTGICMHNVLTLVAVESIEASRANVIFASIPLLIALFDIAILKRLPTARASIALLIGVAGTAVVVTDGRPAALWHGAIGRGEWLILASAASWAAYSVIGRPLLVKYSPLVVTFRASLFGTVMLMPFVLLDLDVLGELVRDDKAWFMTAFAGCFNSALGFLWYYQGVTRLGAMATSAYINLVPVFGVGLAAILLKEQPSAGLLSGGLLVLLGLVLLNRVGGRH